MDSLSPSTLRRLESMKSTSVETLPSQDFTDFEKALAYLLKSLSKESPNSKMEERLLIFGGFGGRLDHTLANLSVLSKYTKEFWDQRACNLMMMDQFSTASVILPGKTKIRINQEIESKSGGAGLLPLEGEAPSVETSGLKWNLTGGSPLKFGHFISSSNEIVENEVQMKTDYPLLWTTYLKSAPEYL
eukprot:TRINITY_DN31448_c0_g1_i1.p1 TRINITY_DN31448_c0_g1~~TRINITY_DN31448_c0_g1_i1.p1  ORF type:complete len:188 (-),score=24.65 TRINITY_DN31448_c0_g1_i1:135-698(-)